MHPRYPSLKRDPRFAQLTPEHVAFFRDTLGPSGVIDGLSDPAAADDLEGYNADWMRKYRGQARVVVKPASTAEVSAVLAYCHEHSLAVVPQGGNTGLVGGSVPVFDELVLSTARLNRIRSFDESSGVLVSEAGVVLENADAHLAKHGHLFPLDLGAKGSCHVGGVVATNAGGLRLLRYGSLHGNVLGLEAVLPDGTVLDDLTPLRKNNTGYDLKQLLIGGEGTLGVVTAISILCPPRPKAVNVAFFAVPSYEHARRAFRAAKENLSEIMSAFELMDAHSQALVVTAAGSSMGRNPLEGHPADHPFYVLVETSGSNAEHDGAKLEAFLERVMGEEIVADGTLAQDETQAGQLWGWRERIPEALGHWGGVYKYDVSIPLGKLYSLVEDTRARLEGMGLVASVDTGNGDDIPPVVDVVGYGHMGDGNLHLNVPVRRYDKKVESALEPFVYEWIKGVGGSISAEHGLGLAKKPYIGYSRSETMVKLMKQIKDLYDPVCSPAPQPVSLPKIAAKDACRKGS